MATYRERREARVERLRDWAGKRETKGVAAYQQARQISDTIPLGQPVLVGHHSEGRHRRDLARIDNGYRRAAEHGQMAKRHDERAGNIEAQLATSIYSDDPDAIEQLESRIATLEAERDRIKAYNASCRRAAKTGGTGDRSLLDERQLADLLKVAEHAPYQIGKGGTYPSYALTNLSGNIKRNRDRLAKLRADCAHGEPTTYCRICGTGPFYWVAERPQPDLCLDHGEQANPERYR